MSDKQLQFQWTGLNRQGKIEKGVLNAADNKAAQMELKNKGIDLISLKAKKALQIRFFNSSKPKKIKAKEILLFTRYLATMLSAGLSIVQALDIIARDQENPAMQSLVLDLKNSISGGKTLAESFGQYPQNFSDLYTNLIKAGEKSGTLDKILIRLGNYMEKTENLKRKIKKAMVYPIAIMSVALIVSLILLLFVVPQFQTMFESFGAKLPFFTRMIVNLSDFVRSYWWIFLIVIVGSIWGTRVMVHRSELAKRKIDEWILRIIIIGPILRKGIIARFTRTLATTLESGMPIVEAMRSIAPVMGNRVYVLAVNEITKDVINGQSLSNAIITTKLFPNMAVQMISVGEAAGSLSDMLNKVADYYEGDVNNIVDNLSSLLEPLIMLVLGVIIGTFVIAMYLPIFRIGSLF